MPENKIILLDTMIVGGLFALNKKGNKIEENKTEWKRAVIKIVNIFENKRLLAPPSVCFELMCWDKNWHKFVTEKSRSVFNYSSEPISNETLQIASKFAYTCGESFGETNEIKYKLKSMDPITAAYAINHKYYILTENEKYFPESFFKIVSIEKLILFGKDGKKYRRFLYLLESN
ncbi:hypothetical protein CO009_00415 [Candidatus Shapirobacteria bacterium CG_4_8_14_3_um_filter_35_11]|uniref:PIN domain-containing protein n=4 Tax=Candidatus Shapironibacteriota TaxID=1752721 RepID=A0A2M7BQ20_9BACT|nr:MAG: hypothetical protein COS53_01690 [Candidatus Shapirobacteria bacterium CG03_land_8_20_14_0_80_35_14]PJC81110.1 MAG: hypothetical protein CO009_00415 [Candidatus Shapirobacteria bacterium CG_4_8_14_3_um_filter_35_11]